MERLEQRRPQNPERGGDRCGEEESRGARHCSWRRICSCLRASVGLPLGRGRKVGVSFALGWDIPGEECPAQSLLLREPWED